MNRLAISVVLFICSSAFVCEAASDCSCELYVLQTLQAEKENALASAKELPFTYFEDCQDAFNQGYVKSGVYPIKPPSSARPFKVWCDMETDGGGWIVIQTRFDGLEDFYRTWVEYRNGFGSVFSEHWLGLNYIRHITQNGDYELLIEFTGYRPGEYANARYSTFMVGSEDEKYRLYVGKYSSDYGKIKDALTTHNGSMFTTKDSDNDEHTNNCSADMAKGGWWYKKCYGSNLNGVWMSEAKALATEGTQTTSNVSGLTWRYVFGNLNTFYSLKSVEMKVRRC
ncbi:ryncolin-1-like [Bradysia coprophila]|uniref:ryncolin-1-like n=1 Tax=Bradysia coprophila TaxID=38358 RepID=UPI00187D992D|nr:ryncolin-1-like [Bradysia coprophila]